MANTTPPAKADKKPEQTTLGPNAVVGEDTRSDASKDGTPHTEIVAQRPASVAAFASPVPPQPPKAPAQPTRGGMVRVPVRNTGLEQSDGSGRYVRVLKESYINGAVLHPGAITPWPAGVEVLGANLEEYKGD